MRKLLLHIYDLVILLAVVVLLFTAGRAYFYFNFQHSFDAFNNSQVLYAFLSGFEYDLKVVLIVNFIFIILFFAPIKLYNSSFYLSVLKFLYFTFNSLALLFNLLDINSYEYNGKRISITNLKDEVFRMLNDFKDFNFSSLIKNYVIILVCFIIIIIILKSLLDFIQRRDFELPNVKKAYLAFTLILLGLYGWFAYDFIANKEGWLCKLYLKADRKLAPLVMNNPYLYLSSAVVTLPEEQEYWDQVAFQSEKRYDSLTNPPVNHIGLVFIDNNDSSFTIAGSKDVSDQMYQFEVFQSGFNSIDRYLDEALLSIPSVLPYEFCQSVYSLNNFESLPQILEKRSFKSNLYSIGYSTKQIKLLKNFHGFKITRLLDSLSGSNSDLISSILGENGPDSTKKTFDVILLRGTEEFTTESLLKAYLSEIKKDGLVFIVNISNANQPQTARLLKSMRIYLPAKANIINQVNVLAQCLDIKPSILHYLNQHTAFIAFGSSLFEKEEKNIFINSGLNNYYLLKDSLLLNYRNNQTASLKLIKNNKILPNDYKDSLAVEKIEMENRIHSIFQDFEYRIENNKMK